MEIDPLKRYNIEKRLSTFNNEDWLYKLLGDKFTGKPVQALLEKFKQEIYRYKVLLITCMNSLYKLKNGNNSLITTFIGEKSVEEFLKKYSDDKEITPELYKTFVIKYTSNQIISQLPKRYIKWIIPYNQVTLPELQPNSTITIYQLIILHIIFDILFIVLLDCRNNENGKKYNFYNCILLYRQILEDDINKLKLETISKIELVGTNTIDERDDRKNLKQE